MPDNMVKIGLIQTSCSIDRKKNIAQVSSLIEKTCDDGAHIVCLQELFNSLYFPQAINIENFKLAEPVNGPTVNTLSHTAKKNKVFLIVPIFEVENNAYYNTAVVLNPSGEIMGKYRKNHIPQNNGYQEKYYFRPGNLGFPVFETPYCKFGISICWDHWFIETQRAYALQGCEIVFSPTALGNCNFADVHIDEKYMTIWETMIKGQCIQNGIYMVITHRTGREDNIDFWGNSLVCNPKGEIIACLNKEDNLLVTDVDINISHEWLEHQQFWRDRRDKY